VLDALQQEGLDLSHCRLVDGPNSYSTVELVDGDRVFGPGNNGVNSLIQLTPDDYVYISTFDVIHTSVFSHLENDMLALKQASRCLSFDFSQERDPAYLAKILPHIDIALISCSDLSLDEQEEFMRQTQAAGPGLVLVTRGSEGSWVFDGRQLYHQGIFPAQVVDTLGAGDAFAARFLIEVVAGQPIPLAMQLAARSAAENCTHFGAFGYAQPM